MVHAITVASLNGGEVVGRGKTISYNCQKWGLMFQHFWHKLGLLISDNITACNKKINISWPEWGFVIPFHVGVR